MFVLMSDERGFGAVAPPRSNIGVRDLLLDSWSVGLNMESDLGPRNPLGEFGLGVCARTPPRLYGWEVG